MTVVFRTPARTSASTSSRRCRSGADSATRQTANTPPRQAARAAVDRQGPFSAGRIEGCQTSYVPPLVSAADGRRLDQRAAKLEIARVWIIGLRWESSSRDVVQREAVSLLRGYAPGHPCRRRSQRRRLSDRGVVRALRPPRGDADLRGRRGACPPSRSGDRLSPEHRLAEPSDRHQPHDRLRLRHGRDDAFAGHLIWGALDAAREQGHLLFIGETEGDTDLEQGLIEAMQDRGVDGVILASMYTRKITSPRCWPTGPPSCSTPSPPTNPRSVSGARRGRGGTHVARVLLEAGHQRRDRPHRRGPAEPRPKGQPRRSSTPPGHHRRTPRANAEIAGAVACPDWQPEDRLRGHPPTPEEDQAVSDHLLQRPLALGAYQALADSGLDVPGDVSVVSFDDDLMAIWVRPRLTTVALPHYELGRVAINLLLSEEGRSLARTGTHYPPHTDATPRTRIGTDTSLASASAPNCNSRLITKRPGPRRRPLSLDATNVSAE